MVLPECLLAAFIRQQRSSNPEEEELGDGEAKSSLSPVLAHLHTMLLLVRIEKAKYVAIRPLSVLGLALTFCQRALRPLKEMLPALIVCHNLAKTGDPSILASSKKAILPASESADASGRATRLFFKHLTFFLTCLDTDVRRYTSEWLFLLCEENGTHLSPQLVPLSGCCPYNFTCKTAPMLNKIITLSVCPGGWRPRSPGIHAPHWRGERDRLAAHERAGVTLPTGLRDSLTRPRHCPWRASAACECGCSCPFPVRVGINPRSS